MFAKHSAGRALHGGRVPRREATRCGDQRGRFRPRRGRKPSTARWKTTSPANSRSAKWPKSSSAQPYKVTRVGEIIGKKWRSVSSLPFGVADLSLAPTPAVGDSVGEIFQSVGLSSIGAPGTTAVLAMLNDAVKGRRVRLVPCGRFVRRVHPGFRDSSIEAATRSGALSLEKLEAMTSVCSVGLDMIAIPGDTPAATISGIIADEMAIGMINSKTTAVRVIPVPGKGVGEKACFGGLLGEADIIPVPGGDASTFISLGGRIPAPIGEELRGIGEGEGNLSGEGSPSLPIIPPPSQDFHLCGRPPHRFSAIAKLSVPRVQFWVYRILLALCLFTSP
ncbi:MAG: DUF711 family protein [Bilophila wadsworthia]